MQFSFWWYDFANLDDEEKGGKAIPAQKKATNVHPKLRLKTIQIFPHFVKSSSSFVLALIF